jgi:hypothetical protein
MPEGDIPQGFCCQARYLAAFAAMRAGLASLPDITNQLYAVIRYN